MAFGVKGAILVRLVKNEMQGVPVSLPREATHCPAATADAEPPDDPPGTLSRSHGFRVHCKIQHSRIPGAYATSLWRV